MARDLWPKASMAKRSGIPTAAARSAHPYRNECRLIPWIPKVLHRRVK